MRLVPPVFSKISSDKFMLSSEKFIPALYWLPGRKSGRVYFENSFGHDWKKIIEKSKNIYQVELKRRDKA